MISPLRHLAVRKPAEWCAMFPPTRSMDIFFIFTKFPSTIARQATVANIERKNQIMTKHSSIIDYVSSQMTERHDTL